MRGLSSTEAVIVVAYVAGLHATDGGWTVRQIEQLVALRSLVACGGSSEPLATRHSTPAAGSTRRRPACRPSA
jgi:hypothetical protein